MRWLVLQSRIVPLGWIKFNPFEELDRNATIQRRIHAEHDLSHRALAERSEQPILIKTLRR